MSQQSGEKTEKPTPKKLKDARAEGTVARTQELGAWTVMLLVAIWLRQLLGYETGQLKTLATQAFASAAKPEVSTALEQLGAAFNHIVTVSVVFGVVVCIVSFSAGGAQGGVHVARKALKPKWSRLNPLKGAKRIFGPQAAWEGVKVLVKTSVVGWVVYGAIMDMLPMVGGIVPREVLFGYAGDAVTSLVRNAAIAGLVMAVADYGMARRRFMKQVKMTKAEVKAEHKNTEGDPLLKSAIRSRQLSMARSRMMAEVVNADVLLVNPTHVAVALVYDPDKGAPRVVARGAGAIAARIREKAAEGEVPMVRDVPLARALYRSCKVGQEIPAELFAAVAHVLAFVMSVKDQPRFVDVFDSPRPTQELPDVPRVRRRHANPSRAAAKPSENRRVSSARS